MRKGDLKHPGLQKGAGLQLQGEAFLARVYSNACLCSAYVLNVNRYCKVDATGIVMRHIIKCFKEPLLRVDHHDTFKIWLDRPTFQEYVLPQRVKGFSSV